MRMRMVLQGASHMHMHMHTRMRGRVAGCYWFVDWYEAADNPKHEWRPVRCPAALTALTGDGFTRDPSQYLEINAAPPSAPPSAPPPTSSPLTNGNCSAVPSGEVCQLTEEQASRSCRCEYGWQAECGDVPVAVSLTCRQ